MVGRNLETAPEHDSDNHDSTFTEFIYDRFSAARADKKVALTSHNNEIDLLTLKCSDGVRINIRCPRRVTYFDYAIIEMYPDNQDQTSSPQNLYLAVSDDKVIDLLNNDGNEFKVLNDSEIWDLAMLIADANVLPPQ